MSESIFDRIVVPVKNTDDATATATALKPHLEPGSELVVLLHVIEQTDGYVDTASPAALKEEANRIFDAGMRELPSDAPTQSALRYGTDAVDVIVDAIDEFGATAVVFEPSPDRRLTDLLTRSAEQRLVEEANCPVIAIHGDDYKEVEN